MTVVFNLHGPANAAYGRRFFAGFSMLVFLEILRYSICNAMGAYFLPMNLKAERRRVSCLCLLAYAVVVSAILASFRCSSYGESFVMGMVLAVLVYWPVHLVLWYINQCWRRLSALADILIASIVWGLVLLSMASV